MKKLISALCLSLCANAAILSMSSTPTPSPSASCNPRRWFLDANGDGLIDIDGAQWYGWYDVDNPSGDGDFENIGYLNGRYWWSINSELSSCVFPIDVQCVTVDAAEIPWKDLGLNIRYNRHWGCECINSENGFACVDMKVKYLCPPAGSEAYYGCNPPSNYIPEGSGIGSASATASSTQTPTASASCVPQLYFLDADQDGLLDVANAQWYGWYSIDGPAGMGEFEHIDYVNGGPGAVLSDLSFCPRPLDVQCVEINSETPWDQLDLNIHFDPHYGCYCINSENTNACVNMKIKYLCPPQSEQSYFGCSPPVNYILASNPLASYSNTATPTPSMTFIPTATSSASASASSSWTRTPSITVTPSNTPSSSFTLTPSSIRTPSNTPTPSNTKTSSITGTPSNTPSSSFTPTPSSSFTPTPSNTRTSTNTSTPSSSQTPSGLSLPSISFIPSASFTPTPSNTITPSLLISPSSSPASQILPSSSAASQISSSNSSASQIPPSSSLGLSASQNPSSAASASQSPLLIPSYTFEVSPNLSGVLIETPREEDAGAATIASGSSPGEVAGFTFLGLFLVAAAIGIIGFAYRKKQQKEKPSLPIKAPQQATKSHIFEQNPMMRQTENPMMRPMSINPIGHIENQDLKTMKHEKLAFTQMRIMK